MTTVKQPEVLTGNLLKMRKRAPITSPTLGIGELPSAFSMLVTQTLKELELDCDEGVNARALLRFLRLGAGDDLEEVEAIEI